METMAIRPALKRLKRVKKSKSFSPDLLVQLYELLQGERESVRVYSKALDSELYFVNSEDVAHQQKSLNCPVYTTRELAFVLSLSPSELKRYHYLKQKLA